MADQTEEDAPASASPAEDGAASASSLSSPEEADMAVGGEPAGDAEAGSARFSLPPWAAPAAAGLAAGLVLVLGTSLIVMSLSRPADGPEAPGASTPDERRDEVAGLRADLEEIARLVADSSGEVVSKQSARIAELEAALRESEAKRKELEDVLHGQTKADLPAELVRAFDDANKVAKVRAISSSHKQRLLTLRKHLAREMSRHGVDLGRDRSRRRAEYAREREQIDRREREWLADAHRRRQEFFEKHIESVTEYATRALEDAARKADYLGRKGGLGGVIAIHEEIAALAGVVSSEEIKRIAAESKKAIARLKQRAEEEEREKQRAVEAKEKVRRARELAAKRKAEEKARLQPKRDAGKRRRPPEESVAPDDDEVF